ncbi:hypothetical protein AB7W18_20750, partial [Providencia rettgeri]
MFNKLRSLFSSKKTHSKQSPINELLLTDEEVKAVEYAHNCILIQMISGGAIKEGDTKSVFHDAKYITPWIIGYLALMNPLMILVKIIKLRWIHILSYDQ